MMLRLTAIGLLGGLTAGSALADTGLFSVELNGAHPAGTACRLDIVFHNGLGTDLAQMGLELVAFTPGGGVERFVTIETGWLPAGKTRVRQYDLPDLECDDLARLLVNDVKICDGDGLTPQDCLARLEVSGSERIGLEL